MDPRPTVTGILIKRVNLDTEMHREKAAREKTVTYKPRRKVWNRSFPRASQKKPTLPTHWSWASASRTVRHRVALLRTPSCGVLFQQPWETNCHWHPSPRTFLSSQRLTNTTLTSSTPGSDPSTVQDEKLQLPSTEVLTCSPHHDAPKGLLHPCLRWGRVWERQALPVVRRRAGKQ